MESSLRSSETGRRSTMNEHFAWKQQLTEGKLVLHEQMLLGWISLRVDVSIICQKVKSQSVLYLNASHFIFSYLYRFWLFCLSENSFVCIPTLSYACCSPFLPTAIPCEWTECVVFIFCTTLLYDTTEIILLLLRGNYISNGDYIQGWNSVRVGTVNWP